MSPRVHEKILLLPSLILLLVAGSFARVIVFPFQVHNLEKKNHQWLGQAISFYISNGLELNSIETVKDPQIHSVLNSHNISFPYVFSKATGIKLAGLTGADHIIWGEVDASEQPQTHNVQVKTYIIDMKQLTQKYLPLVKFHLLDFYVVQKELLEMVLDFFHKKEARFPELNLDYHHYEMFIKSLLLEDNEKKLGLLEKVSQEIHDSDYLNLELSKCHLCLGDISGADQALKKISGKQAFRSDKDFILGLIFYHQGRFTQARELFSKLRQQNVYIPEATNNLGILSLKKNPPAPWGSYFLQSIQSRKDPEVYLNFIKGLLETGNIRLAGEILKEALRYFPDDEELIRVFGYMLSREKNQKQLYTIFQTTIPQLTLTTTCPVMAYKIKNPFELQSGDFLPQTMDSGLIPEDPTHQGIEPALQRLRESMEINPFLPELHRAMSRLLKQKNRTLSKWYQMSAQFLEPDQNRSG